MMCVRREGAPGCPYQIMCYLSKKMDNDADNNQCQVVQAVVLCFFPRETLCQWEFFTLSESRKKIFAGLSGRRFLFPGVSSTLADMAIVCPSHVSSYAGQVFYYSQASLQQPSWGQKSRMGKLLLR